MLLPEHSPNRGIKEEKQSMKPFDKQYDEQVQPQQPTGQSFCPGDPSVRRHVHPIRTSPPSGRSDTEQALNRITEALARQTELLEELLRRTESDNSDTK